MWISKKSPPGHGIRGQRGGMAKGTNHGSQRLSSGISTVKNRSQFSEGKEPEEKPKEKGKTGSPTIQLSDGGLSRGGGGQKTNHIGLIGSKNE